MLLKQAFSEAALNNCNLSESNSDLFTLGPDKAVLVDEVAHHLLELNFNGSNVESFVTS